ncbi:CAT RNA binding domain-containing protein [Ligilactobacillus aviarius]|uniref:CAT RNA binding domain-containing protein n=1 Tax=Ligilactobacillus aviarius TaxID=1606 RepID=UPI002431BEE0|nr:CAT RNA binding domain-containing protein [Ligilactobacillus aviarius]
MRYLKNFNNNAALVEDDSGKEYVIIGNGIGFGKHPGDLVDEGRLNGGLFHLIQIRLKLKNSKISGRKPLK